MNKETAISHNVFLPEGLWWGMRKGWTSLCPAVTCLTRVSAPELREPNCYPQQEEGESGGKKMKNKPTSMSHYIKIIVFLLFKLLSFS